MRTYTYEEKVAAIFALRRAWIYCFRQWTAANCYGPVAASYFQSQTILERLQLDLSQETNFFPPVGDGTIFNPVFPDRYSQVDI